MLEREGEVKLSTAIRACDDSQLCAELSGETEGVAFHALYQGDPPSRTIAECDNFALVVDIAPLSVGHTLLVPKDHYINFGTIPSKIRDELDSFREACVALISERYGIPTILEHGSSSAMRGSACISHAHWHLIPGIESSVRIFERDGLRGKSIDSWQDLRAVAELDRPYIYYNFGSSHRVYSANLSKRHQYIRMVIAEVLGIAEPEWDWALSRHPEFLRTTIKQLEDGTVYDKLFPDFDRRAHCCRKDNTRHRTC
jgi:diadenosine tetraphosphate (Ap4A) HIT family hydrolase